ncbi:hypothetical protein W02_37100 [Nitrospira sp. KM1]|nr:hypothetical protein W02_37100 [Nitrospira sp. KM1]
MTDDRSQDEMDSMGSPAGPSDEAIVWFARLSSGEMTDRERTKFWEWRNHSADHEQAFVEICRLWDKPELMEAAGALAGLGTQAESRSIPERHWVRALVAAVVLLIVSAVAYQFDVPIRFQADWLTAVGERQTITLADESTVILNTNSAIASNYRPDSRRVQLLKGEAMFKVQPDATRPFLVEHGGLVARAVGTAFVVRESGNITHVSVVEGVVSVESSTASQVTLEAGQRAIMNADGKISVQSIDTDVTLAWLQGRLVFENTPFVQVIEEISRYHGGYIGVWNPSLAGLAVSGTYNLSNPTTILATLTKTLPVQMTRITDRFVVFR